MRTTTTISAGTIDGTGTLWARWDTSEWIGGTIFDQYRDPVGPLTTMYYGDRPVEASWVQIMSGSIVVLPPCYGNWSFTD